MGSGRARDGGGCDDDQAIAGAIAALGHSLVGAEDLAPLGVLGDGPLTDLGEAIAAGVFDGDAGSERAEPSDDELEAREARGTSALRLICRERYFRQGRLGSVGQHVDAHGAAITALAAETSRRALEAAAVQPHVDDTDQDGDGSGDAQLIGSADVPQPPSAAQKFVNAMRRPESIETTAVTGEFASWTANGINT